MLRELRDALPEMLRGRRSGVAAALLAAAGRTGNAAVQADAVRALASALSALQSAGGAAEGQVCKPYIYLNETYPEYQTI